MAAVLSAATQAAASPNLPLDDPDYVELVRALGRQGLPLAHGGLLPLTENEARKLLDQAGAPVDPLLIGRQTRGWWAMPLRRLTQRFAAVYETTVPYSPPAQVRLMAGEVALSCEHQEGRPCGDGVGAMLELDSAVGYGHWLSAFTRFRLSGGMNGYGASFAVDRAYLNAELGPVAIEAGRDILVLGPGRRTQLLWSDNAPPLDQIRISTAHPLQIPRIPVKVSLFFAFGRLREPQRFEGTMVTLARIELELLRRLELGVTNLLQLGGDGAPAFSFGDFILEHLWRQREENAGGISNRRLSFDVSWFCRTFHSRFYYELAFEDWRYQLGSALAYDADHLLGWEMPVLPRLGRHGLLVEVHRTGVRSQEHGIFTTGMTNEGRAVGSPLGPDSWSVFVGARLDLRRAVLWPWVEYVRRSSDHFSIAADQAIFRVSEGPAESRYRAGLRLQARVNETVRVDLRTFVEMATTAAFVAGNTRGQAGVELGVTWTPHPQAMRAAGFPRGR